ncbi:MAG TPA: DUF5668 domain-containing protein [Thermoanaerobaculia bacterium]|nr:DUF5668 domain-containing protein [Thermoanaerobaculia bacterium]
MIDLGDRLQRKIRRRAERRARRRSRAIMAPLLFGLGLMAVGVWFVVDTFLLPLPGPDRLWPFAPMLFGVAMIGSYVLGGLRDPARVFPGMAALLVGAFFLLVTLGPLDWDQMDALWPVFPLLGGVAFFWTWLAHFGRHNGLLVPAALGISTGVIGLFFTLTPLGPAMVTVAWPLILIGVGALMVSGVVLRLLVRTVGVAGRRAF